MTLIAILGLIWAILSIVWLIVEIAAAVQSIVYFGTPVSAGLVLGFGWKMTGLLLITAYLLPAIKPALVWIIKLVCGWLGIGQVALIESGVNLAADAAQTLTGGINLAAGKVGERVQQARGSDHADVCSVVMKALGGPDYVELISQKDGKVTRRVFGTPPAQTSVNQSPKAAVQTPVPAPQPQPAAAPIPGATT